MTSKVCPRCQGKSYSAAHRADWICPYCGENLRNIPSDDEVCAKSVFTTENKERRIRLFVIKGGNLQKNVMKSNSSLGGSIQ